ncbi:MAG: HAD-IA family hydrolase, partial [Dethiosulfovibrio sp.]|nr:HAD-IA family hydrolase [Dethiosulfovibrio sp.]
YAGIVPFDDTISMLSELRSMGVKVGVATSRQIAEPVVRAVGIFDLLDVVMGLGNEHRPKPEPDMVLAAMDMLGSSPEETVYVGDTDIDMRTARAAAIRGIGVTTGNFSASSLKEAGAWRTMDGVGLLVDLVREESL